MITVSDELTSVLRAGGFQRSFVADVVVDGQRVLEDFPITCELKSSASARIRTQGSAVITYSDELGRSIVPEDLTSWLTPYATYLNTSIVISAGDFSEKVLLGVLKVVAVRDPIDTSVQVAGRRLSIGSQVRVSLADKFVVTDRERFIAPGSPSILDSVWGELGVLTGLPLLRNVADVPITRAVTYQENRLAAVLDLGTILDGVPHMNADGYLAIEPNEWPAVSETLAIGPEGTVTRSGPGDWSDEKVYNQVVVRSHDDSQVRVLATDEVLAGPLRYGGPFGRVPYFASSQFVTTEEQAVAYAASLLPQVSSLPAAEFKIQCLPDPRLEVGDVVEFPYNDETLTGRIIERILGSVGLMTLTLTVNR